MRLLWTALVLAGAAFAQENGPRFEVATIKPASPDARGTFINSTPGGRISIMNMTLKDMITLAWQVQPYQVTGGPAWMESAHYDITAKAESAPKQGDVPKMLQALLADRFQLVIRKESREMPIYAIVLARKDGKLGPQLVESKEGSCVQYDPQHPPPPPEPGKPPVLGCGGLRMGPNELIAAGSQVSNMTQVLARTLGRTVIDKTGLTAKYDIKMTWTPDESQLAQLPTGVDRAAFGDGGPSIYTAMQEQLGLKLESQKGPVEVLVIEKAEKPTEN